MPGRERAPDERPFYGKKLEYEEFFKTLIDYGA